MAANRPIKQKIVLEALKNGLTRQEAADAAGIHRDTIHDWEATDSTFSDAIVVSQAGGVLEALKTIRKAGDKDWRALAWWVEHCPRTKDRWKRAQEITVRDLSDVQLIALLREFEAGGDSPGDRLATAGAEGE